MVKETRSKRSIISDSEEVIEEEDEDLKVEKFYELIRSFHDACGHRRRSKSTTTTDHHHHHQSDDHDQVVIKNKKMKIMKMKEDEVDHHEKPIWVPSFKSEDFKGEIKFRNPPPPRLPLMSPGTCSKQGTKKEEDESTLDLKLTL
ncbi:hypothetical protein BVC80_1543g140 [Macleaya cordata]|uniref:NIM1-interacting protein 1/3 n=1 Tax=Macleaya cordata TaxID=56857 RepID=A0A200R1Z8_MACCD|nr:hypothetical protein BVC80_1543g140 [Macleaya cordata]